MRWKTALVAVAALLGVGIADTLEVREGMKLRGTLREVTFMSNGIRVTYPREDIVGLTLGEKADRLQLQDEVALDGRLVSLAFQTSLGIRTLLRPQIKAFTFDSATTLEAQETARAEEELKAEEPKKNLTEEQRNALRLNYKLYKDYLAKAEEQKDKDLEAIKTKYNSRVNQIVGKIRSLEKQIEAKERRRRDAQYRGATYREYGSTTGRIESEYERLLRTDGLEKDRVELRKAWQQAIDLKKIIRAQQRKALEKKQATEKRILAVGIRNKKAILQGKIPSQEQMTADYEAALAAGVKKN